MTDTPRPVRSLGFVHIAPFDRDSPREGLDNAIELFRYAEELGLDSGWLRTRHLQHGVSSSPVLFGAISQHTERIKLGHAVIPVGHDNPFRLAEDLATVDVLSGGRLQPGLSVHPPKFADDVNDIVFDRGWREQDYGYGRIELLRELLAGRAVREIPPYQGIGGDFDSDRVEPHSPGLADRLWYGGGSLRSAEWAGHAGLNWLVSNISTTADGDTDFARVQRGQIDAFRAHHPAGEQAHATVARVAVPTDAATGSQLRRYREYVQRRTPRTRQIQGKNTIIALDILGSTDEIVEVIRADAAFRAAEDYLFELPFELELEDWKHILHQLATRVGPALGWAPAAERREQAA
ncbi:LLM class flavin-dependent oxidoreductase [Microbacterium protaetiae]|uniref:LLM class flavin-dependent oxidoreductase n=1 Tax=Microbacterium protaetiae TaxID=2509458 RepID=A0A4P6ERF1_9MICO|nr:LLM class flavin-dependent oxidoreductase [Microbacterium protaetiae]QAY60488.1 LLM class flavin-dependent oxidoreductase [Microbacterium protaetiae]